MRHKKSGKCLMALALSAVMLFPAPMTYAEERLETAELGIETHVESGTADENGFVIDENGVLTKYTGDAENVVIPDNVTRVAYHAFNGCYKVKSIYIPKSVREVDGTAFATDVSYGTFGKNYGSLENLEVAPDNPYFSSEDGVLYDKNKEKLICCPGARTGSFVVPAGVNTIGSGAFEGCRLTSIEIPAGVTHIEDTYFCRCSYELTELKVDAGNRNYSTEDGILYDKDKKTLLTCPGGKVGNIEIPAGVTNIAGFSFTSCHELRNIRIPSSVTSIGDAAFNLLRVNIIIPTEVTYIAESAISSGATIYGKEGSYAQTYAAEHNIEFSTEQSGFDIKDGVLVKYIGMDTEVVIPTGVTSIGNGAFAGNRELTSVTIPNGVTSIGVRAFQSCSYLTAINLPEGLTSIGSYTF